MTTYTQGRYNISAIGTFRRPQFFYHNFIVTFSLIRSFFRNKHEIESIRPCACLSLYPQYPIRQLKPSTIFSSPLKRVVCLFVMAHFLRSMRSCFISNSFHSHTHRTRTHAHFSASSHHLCKTLTTCITQCSCQHFFLLCMFNSGKKSAPIVCKTLFARFDKVDKRIQNEN